MTDDVCPRCKQPYSAAAVADGATIEHPEAKQIRTCLKAKTGEGGPKVILIYHEEDDLEGDADEDSGSTEAEADDQGADEGGLDPAELSGDRDNVFRVIRDCSRSSSTTMAEVKGQCSEFGMSPSDVDRVVEELVEMGFVHAPRSSHVEVAPGVA